MCSLQADNDIPYAVSCSAQENHSGIFWGVGGVFFFFSTAAKYHGLGCLFTNDHEQCINFEDTAMFQIHFHPSAIAVLCESMRQQLSTSPFWMEIKVT